MEKTTFVVIYSMCSPAMWPSALNNVNKDVEADSDVLTPLSRVFFHPLKEKPASCVTISEINGTHLLRDISLGHEIA